MSWGCPPPLNTSLLSPSPAAAGIVHRDVKPHNCIVSTVDRRIKLIDFGAAADLRIGINYVPNQYLLDPRYAPPQQYIMSKHTPRCGAAGGGGMWVCGYGVCCLGMTGPG